MMEEVAEKAAKQAAQSVSRDIQLEMLRMEQRVRSEIAKDTKALFVEFLGMNPNEHAIEHRDMHDLNKHWKEFQSVIIKKVTSIVVTGALLVALATNGLPDIIKPKNENQAIHPHNNGPRERSESHGDDSDDQTH